MLVGVTRLLCVVCPSTAVSLFSPPFSLPLRQNLKREGFRGLTNPYCQLNVGRQGPYTTDVVFDSVNPSWEHKRQTFEFRVSAQFTGGAGFVTCITRLRRPRLQAADISAG